MKARRVKGLDPDGPVADQLARVVLVRADELASFMPAAADPGEVEALHDMRIAAKRLRYVLELSSHLFGPYAAEAGKRAKELQDLLGEIHDCDVTLPRIAALGRRALEEDARAARSRGADEPDLDPARAAGLPRAAAHRGLATFQAYLRARRALLFDRFLERWQELQREGFAARLEFAVSERPSPDVHAGRGAGEDAGPRP